MKTAVVFASGILVGTLVGWYMGYIHPLTSANRDARQYMTTLEVDDSTAAIFAVKAIPLVESGSREEATKELVKPIGSYYRIYARDAGGNAERLRVKALIDELARSSTVVAAEIAKPE